MLEAAGREHSFNRASSMAVEEHAFVITLGDAQARSVVVVRRALRNPIASAWPSVGEVLQDALDRPGAHPATPVYAIMIRGLGAWHLGVLRRLRHIRSRSVVLDSSS